MVPQDFVQNGLGPRLRHIPTTGEIRGDDLASVATPDRGIYHNHAPKSGAMHQRPIPPPVRAILL